MKKSVPLCPVHRVPMVDGFSFHESAHLGLRFRGSMFCPYCFADIDSF